MPCYEMPLLLKAMTKVCSPFCYSCVKKDAEDLLITTYLSVVIECCSENKMFRPTLTFSQSWQWYWREPRSRSSARVDSFAKLIIWAKSRHRTKSWPTVWRTERPSKIYQLFTRNSSKTSSTDFSRNILRKQSDRWVLPQKCFERSGIVLASLF